MSLATLPSSSAQSGLFPSAHRTPRSSPLEELPALPPRSLDDPSSRRMASVALDHLPPHPPSLPYLHSYHCPPPPKLDLDILRAVRTKIEIKQWDETNSVYFQIIHNGTSVGRVRETSMVNGTKLLNLAGISRGKRDGILKNEKVRKVVKHGTMHLKGVWIEFERAVYLAEQFKISNMVFPLLLPDLNHYLCAEAGSLLTHKLPPEPPPLILPPHFSHSSLASAPPDSKFPTMSLSLDPYRSLDRSHQSGFHHSSWSDPHPPSGHHSPALSYPEPHSAPPVPLAHHHQRSSLYEQAQLHPLNGDLSERRHTVHSALNGYQSVSVQFGPTDHSPPPLPSYGNTFSAPLTAEFPGFSSHTASSSQVDHPPSPHLFDYGLSTNLSPDSFSNAQQSLASSAPDSSTPTTLHRPATLGSSSSVTPTTPSTSLAGTPLYSTHPVASNSPIPISPSLPSPPLNPPLAQQHLGDDQGPYDYSNNPAIQPVGLGTAHCLRNSPSSRLLKREVDVDEEPDYHRRVQARPSHNLAHHHPQPADVWHV